MGRGRAFAAFAASCVIGRALAAAASPALSPPTLATFEANQANAHFGYFASAAGDVNGDGFVDLLIGQRDYNGGQSNEGRAALYFGSAGGFSAAPDWAFESDQTLAFLGSAVASAGDVNGDGFHDVLVAAPSFDDGESNEGVVFLFLGSSTGLAATPAWTKGGDQTTAAFGSSVAFAGDVNADGFDDVVIGARGADGAFANEGRASLFLGSAAGLSTSAVWSATGGQIDPGYGGSVAGAGDVNGDGFADVLVGAFFHDSGSTDEGAAFLYRGSASGLEAAASWIGEGNESGASYGWSVSGAGDVDGDGYSDVIVGARFDDGGFLNEGKVFVIRGGASGLAATPSWSAVGGESNANFGWSVAGAGDVNGDGLADVVVGAPRKDDATVDAGAASLFLGARTGDLGTAAWTTAGPGAGAQLGYCVTGAGDVNGDGFCDFAIAAPYADAGQTDEGIVRLFAGIAAAPEIAPSFRANGGPTSIAFGRSVAFLGDVNGDGYDDLAVGDPFHSNGQSSEGRVDVFLGTAFGYDTTPDWSVESNQANAFLGTCVARAGDVNGDGYDDLLIGAPNWDGVNVNEGRVTLHYGSAGGLGASPAWTRTGGQNGANFGAAIAGGGDGNGDGFGDFVVGAPLQDGIDLDAGAIHWFRGSIFGPSALAQRMIVGTSAGEELGASVAHAGDVNRDGFSDVLAGAPGYSNGEVAEGIVRLARGAATGVEGAFTWSVEGGQAEARLGGTVAFAGDVNGDGFSDGLASARGFDGAAIDEGRAFLFLGSIAGLSGSAAWTVDGGQESAELDAIASAGDVDGDGKSDLVVGVSLAGVLEDEGIVHCYKGTASGLAAAPFWSRAGGVSFANFGSALGGAGDANGDGFADLAIGAKGFVDAGGTGGATFVACGNGGLGAARIPRQRRVNENVPVALRGASDAGNQFRVALLGRSPRGRSRVRLEIEAKLVGVSFDGAGLVRGPWTATLAPAPGTGSVAPLEQIVAGFYAGAPIHWRARLRDASPFLAASPWISLAGSAAAEIDLRTEDAGPSSAPALAAPTSSALLFVRPTRPHPVRGPASIEIVLARESDTDLAFFDVRGRRVRTLHRGPLAAGAHTFDFNPQDDAGNALAAGVYFARLAAGGHVASRPVVVVR